MRELEQTRLLVAQNRIAEVIPLLGSLFEEQSDSFLVADLDSSTNSGEQRVIRRTVRDAVREIFRSLPDEGKQLYGIQYNSLARRLLNTAIATGSQELLEKVAFDYFYSDSGMEATFLVAMNCFYEGKYYSAIPLLERILQEGDHLEFYEPFLSLTLSICQKKANLDDRAIDTLDHFLRKYPNTSIQLGDESWTPKSAREILDKLDFSLSTPHIAGWLSQSGWLLPNGTPNQQVEVDASIPLLEMTWNVPTVSQPKFEETLSFLEGRLRERKDIFLPVSRPLFVNQTVLFRGMDGIVAINAENGKRRWIGQDVDFKMPISATSYFFNNTIGGQEVNQMRQLQLRVNTWHDRVGGNLSSDGDLLFSIENEPFLLNGPMRQGGLLLRQGQQMNDPREKMSTTITARKVETGEVVWRIGKAPFVQQQLNQLESQLQKEHERARVENERVRTDKEREREGEQAVEKREEKISDRQFQEEQSELLLGLTEEECFLGETYFLSTPLPVLGNLYVLGENGGILYLFVFDSQTGQLLRHNKLIRPQTPIESDWLRRFRGAELAYQGGLLVCATSSGVLCVLDTQSEEFRWGYSYIDPVSEEELDSDKREGELIGIGQRGLLNRRFSGTDEDFRFWAYESGWTIPSCLLLNGKLVFAPTDQPVLYCFDLISGNLLWSRPKDKARYVACLYENLIVLATEHSMMSYDLTTGEKGWNGRETYFSNGAIPSGTGLKKGNTYMIPLSDHSLGVIDLTTGKLQRTWKSLDETPLGNLLAMNGKVFSQSARTLTCFNQMEPLRERALERQREQPDDPDALFVLGRIAYAEENTPLALSLFQECLRFQSQYKPREKSVLRNMMCVVFRSNTLNYRPSLDDIETLSDSPEIFANLLKQYAVYCLNQQDKEQFKRIFEKLIVLNQQERLVLESEDHREYLLAFWIQEQVHALQADPEIGPFLLTLAQKELQQIIDQFNGEQRFSTNGRKTTEQLERFLIGFSTLPIADSALSRLCQDYLENKQFSQLECLLARCESLEKLSEQVKTTKKAYQSLTVSTDEEQALMKTSWPNGPVILTEEETEPDQGGKTSSRAGPYQSGFPVTMPIPYVGENPIFQDEFSFHLTSVPNQGLRLLCRNKKGQNEWMIPLPDEEGEFLTIPNQLQYLGNQDFRFSDQTGFLKGLNHLLFFIRGKTILAIDVLQRDQLDRPVILWKKQVSTPFGNVRFQENALKLSQLNSSSPLFSGTGEPFVFWADPVVLNAHALCFQDGNTLWGLDPLSGKMCWKRELTQNKVLFASDEQFLYQITPNSLTASLQGDVRISPTQRCEVQVFRSQTGQEITRGVLPQGIIHCFGSKFVAIRTPPSPDTAIGLDVFDMRDFIQRELQNQVQSLSKEERRARALSVKPDDFGRSVLNPHYSFSTPLTYDALVHFREQGRVIDVLEQTGHLQSVDLKSIQADCPIIRCSPTDIQGAQLERERINSEKVWGIEGNPFVDFQVMKEGDDWLVLFIFDRNIQKTMLGSFEKTEETATSESAKTRTPLQGVPQRAIGEGIIMRYDAKGIPIWTNARRIANWYSIPNHPDYPIILFGATIFEEQPNLTGQTGSTGQPGSTGQSGVQVYPVLLGIDKKTGDSRFLFELRNEFTPSVASMKELSLGLRLVLDPGRNQIRFITPKKTFHATFTQEK
ncbi:MAG: PQQ-binding-like beta-propeller repeat protein [Thermoguttaceae bacterium]